MMKFQINSSNLMFSTCSVCEVILQNSSLPASFWPPAFHLRHARKNRNWTRIFLWSQSCGFMPFPAFWRTGLFLLVSCKSLETMTYLHGPWHIPWKITIFDDYPDWTPDIFGAKSSQIQRWIPQIRSCRLQKDMNQLLSFWRHIQEFLSN